MKVAILGATGYAGQELLRILLRHPFVHEIILYSRKNGEKEFKDLYRNYYGEKSLKIKKLNWNKSGFDEEVVFSALPYGVLMENMTEDMLNKSRFIDIGVDYRYMDEDKYSRYYRREHKNIGFSNRFQYGLCEWNREKVKKAEHIANPGCFATAIQMGLLPLIKEEVIEINNIVVDGKAGYTAGGRNLSLGTHFTEANDSVKAYKILDHPHEDECVESIKEITHRGISLTFVPHMIPMQRGILVTMYCNLKDNYSRSEIEGVFDKYYRDEEFVDILDEGIYVETKWVKSSNKCHLNFKLHHDKKRIVVVCAIDNLIKGAAGQAVQNFNIMFGYKEKEGLDFIPNCL